MSLFDDIFRELDSIITTLDHAGREFDFENDVKHNMITPADATEGLIMIEKILTQFLIPNRNLNKNL